MSERDLYAEAIARWGAESQLRMLQEECGELVAAVNHVDRKRFGPAELAGEIADVEIMCAQARIVIGSELVDTAKQAKLERLASRLDAAEGPCPHGISPATDCDDCAAARRAEERRETESLRADHEHDRAKDERIDFPERGGHE